MIQTEPTPNPNSLKFLSENIISTAGTEEFQKDKSTNVSNPFIKELLQFKGVELVLLAKNFISVKKSEEEKYMKDFKEGTNMYNAYYEINTCIPCPPGGSKSKRNKSGFCPIPVSYTHLTLPTTPYV